MKIIAILLLTIPFGLLSQSLALDFSQSTDQSTSFEISSISFWLQEQQMKQTILPARSQIFDRPYQSPLRNFTQDQFLMNVNPDLDFSNLTDVILGSFTSQTFSIGNLNLTQAYLFDRSGNLRSSQLSFNVGRN